jgi:hypothetical protein
MGGRLETEDEQRYQSTFRPSTNHRFIPTPRQSDLRHLAASNPPCRNSKTLFLPPLMSKVAKTVETKFFHT